jgi:tetratricopeptide (TPR) repeat protein
VGDANLARDRRERLAAIRPNDRDNLLSLGDIYLRLNDAVKAAQIVERVKALGVDLDVVTLQAAVLWAENKQAEAKAAFTAFAEAAPDNRAKLETGIAAARFLFSRSDVDGSATVLESVRQYQDPKAMEADRALSDLFLQAGDSKRGIEPLERILAAGGDTPESTYRKRMVETLMSLGRFTDAERELAPLLRATNPDFVSVLLHASIRGGLNDVTGQRRILDDAVTKFPKEPAVFLRRGQFLAQNDETLRDAIADFSQAAQIAPNLWQTYRLRAGAYARIRNAAGEPTEVDRVIDDLKQALQLNPFDNDLLVGLVSDLLRLNRDAEAQRAVEAAVKVRPREAIIFVQMGNLFQGAGRLKIAQDFFEQAWALNKGDGIAQRMLDSLLDPRSMNVRRAEEIINELGAQRVTANPGFLMAVAKIRTSQNQLQLANRAVLDALRLLDPARDNLMMIWHQDMLRLQPDRRQHIQFLEAAINQGTVPGAADWLGFFRASLQTEDPASLSDGVKGLELLARGANPPIIRLLSWRMLGGKHYGQNRFDLAQAAWTEGLKAFPDDPELNNNLAYLLTVHLNKCAEAIPLAQQAAKSSPRNADIADTLAFALFKCGRVTEALTTYEGALKLVTAARTGVHVLSHYAEALLEHSKQAPTAEERQRLVQQAKDQISMAENILSQPGVQVDEATRAEYDRVKALVGK